MIAGRVMVQEEGSLIIEFSEGDLRLSQNRQFYSYGQGEARYFGVDIASDIIKDGLKVIMSKTIDQKIGQYMSMIPSLIPYAEKMKLKLFSEILPSLVKQYHEESFFDVKLNPSDL